MKTNKSLNLFFVVTLFIFLSSPLSPASGSDADKQSPLQPREIGRIDFRDLPEQIEFVNPSRIAINSKNQLFVTDTRANNIKVFDAQGQFLKSHRPGGKRARRFIQAVVHNL